MNNSYYTLCMDCIYNVKNWCKKHEWKINNKDACTSGKRKNLETKECERVNR